MKDPKYTTGLVGSIAERMRGMRGVRADQHAKEGLGGYALNVWDQLAV